MDKNKLVSDDACMGCLHYRYFDPCTRCCNYCYDTGNARPRGELPAQCSVRVNGNRAVYIMRLVKDGLLAPEILSY